MEDMKVTVFEGSTEDIITKVKESDSNLFKVAVVQDIGSSSEFFVLQNILAKYFSRSEFRD